MVHALHLAAKGIGFVAPNPMVGAVIVYQDRIIGEGFHKQYGGPHAEVEALNAVHPDDFKYLPESTLYVSLEPCSHYGKTPPCAHRIVQEGIKKVVVAVSDPNPLVAGNGIKYLRDHDVEVIEGVLSEEAAELNHAFFHFHQTGMPWVTLKWAQSADGFLAGVNRQTIHFTSHESDVFVHRLRAEHQAILVGAATAVTDDPLLTVRHCKGNDPIRIILSDGRTLPDNLRMLTDGGATIVIELGVGDFPKQFFKRLHDLHIISLLVEGGAHTLANFIQYGNWNKIYRFQNRSEIHAGISAPVLPMLPTQILTSGDDRLEIFNR
jgi:diaminohydroxyphosphoribosylaminopyrimidine deaminase / 5-amino-6-(5-phosphoribosylamino)uracil reductase